VYLLGDQRGSMLQVSDLYSTLAGDMPDEVRAVIRKREPTWKVCKDARGAGYLIRSGVLRRQSKSHPAIDSNILRSHSNRALCLLAYRGHRFKASRAGTAGVS